MKQRLLLEFDNSFVFQLCDNQSSHFFLSRNGSIDLWCGASKVILFKSFGELYYCNPQQKNLGQYWVVISKGFFKEKYDKYQELMNYKLPNQPKSQALFHYSSMYVIK